MRYSKLLILLLWVACDFSEPSPDDPRIQDEVEKRIKLKRVERINTCIREATARAEAAVDSTLRVMALDEKLSIYNPPEKPVKPIKPNVPSIQDTSPIVPLDQKGFVRDSFAKKDSIIIED